jgi:hypothetical protein
MEMKFTIGALLAVLALNVQAKPIMYTNNTGGGRIVLTDQPCKTNVGKVAYATHPKSSTQLGCWLSDDVAIHIQWDGSELRSYEYEGWHVIDTKSKTTL